MSTMERALKVHEAEINSILPMNKYTTNMKNYSFLLLLIWPFLFAACDNNGEEFIDINYTKLGCSIVYPSNAAYSITFNGKGIDTTFYTYDELTGLLQVFPNDEETPELDTMITAEPGGSIQLIKLPGKNIELYQEGDFIKFSTTMALYSGYTAMYNGQHIVDGDNYIKKENASGNLEFYGEGETTPVYAIENMTLEAGQNIIILQSSETEFVVLEGGESGEEAPATENLCKLNFFFTPSGALDIDRLRVEIYSYDIWFMSGDLYHVGDVVIEKGKLSSYIELDLAQYQESFNLPAVFACGLYDDETNEEIYNVWNTGCVFEIAAQSDQFKTKYKFATYRITNSDPYMPQFIMGEEWHPATTE
jgi:hypothetical protein